MDFRKYNSIENSYRQLEIDTIRQYGYADGLWVVTEKIHGSNLSFAINGDEEIKVSKRSGWIELLSSFFRADTVYAKYEERIKDLYEIVTCDEKLDDAEVECIQLYGEIYGGYYPHEDVERCKDAKKVQQGVLYCPHNDFYPFDIYVRKADGKSYPLDHDVFERVMEEAGFTIYAKALFTGTFDECLAYQNEYPTTISKLHGLPDLDDNICEGNVLKPVKAMCKPSGSRVILKNKNDRFKEKEASKKVKVAKEISPEVQEAINIAAGYITENRLRNVLSHIGSVSQKEFGKVIGAFSQDVLADFEKENADLLKDFERDELNTVNKSVGKESANLIRANFLNIIDGNF